MRILDEKRDHAVDRATLFLTRSEASEMRDMLDALLSGEAEQHAHVSDSEFQREVTIALYDETDLSYFDDRSRSIIETGQ